MGVELGVTVGRAARGVGVARPACRARAHARVGEKHQRQWSEGFGLWLLAREVTACLYVVGGRAVRRDPAEGIRAPDATLLEGTLEAFAGATPATAFENYGVGRRGHRDVRAEAQRSCLCWSQLGELAPESPDGPSAGCGASRQDGHDAASG